MCYKVDAYTLKLEMTSCPLGSAVNTKDDSAIAASIAIKQEDAKANPLFARAYRLYIPFERVQVCVAEVKGSGAARDSLGYNRDNCTSTVRLGSHSSRRLFDEHRHRP